MNQITYSKTTLPIDGQANLPEVSAEAVQAAYEAIRQRLEQEIVGHTLGLEVKHYSFMAPDECFLVGEKRLVYLKDNRMIDIPLHGPELRPEPYIDPPEASSALWDIWR